MKNNLYIGIVVCVMIAILIIFHWLSFAAGPVTISRASASPLVDDFLVLCGQSASTAEDIVIREYRINEEDGDLYYRCPNNGKISRAEAGPLLDDFLAICSHSTSTLKKAAIRACGENTLCVFCR